MRGGHGVHLGHNDRVDNLELEVISDHWYVLRKATFDYRHRDGRVTREVREAYDRGNGVTILLHDPVAGTVILTRQFRLPVYLNSHPDGMLIETAAGLLDQRGEHPESAIRREALEEAGVSVGEVRRLFELFMSPGSVTERVTFFVATYSHAQRSRGGGNADEGEDIEVLELSLDEALAMVSAGTIDDGKTVILLQWAALRGTPPVRASVTRGTTYGGSHRTKPTESRSAMATTRSATTIWHGSLMEGAGRVELESSGLGGFDVTWASRAEDPAGRTSPEELIGAAHSSCFSMALSNALAKAGTPPETLETKAEVTFQPGQGITGVHLTVRGEVPGMTPDQFADAAEAAKIGCPVSQALTGTIITLTATLA